MLKTPAMYLTTTPIPNVSQLHSVITCTYLHLRYNSPFHPLAGSTKAENTATSVQNHLCCKRPSLENIDGVILKSNSISAADGVVLRHKTGLGSPEGSGSSTPLMEYPQSADILELERNRRSRSEER